MGTWMRSKGVFAVLAAGLTALAMPGIGVWPLAFVCLIPLFFAMEGGRGGRACALFGLTYLALDLRWILSLTRFSPLVILGFLILILASSLFYAAAGVLLTWKTQRFGLGLLVAAPAAFSLIDLARASGELGTTFGAPFHALYRVPILIQASAFFGPWAITAGLVAVNAAFYLALRDRRGSLAATGAGIIALLAAFSLWPLSPETGPQIQVAIVSSQVQQEVKLDARNLSSLTERYIALGESAAEGDPDLIVFPESILPAYILRNNALLDRLSEIARQGGSSVLFGTGEYRNREIFNSVVRLSPEGDFSDVYDMIRPVPFGEYVPWRGVWEAIGLGGLADSFLPLDLTAGTEFTLLDGIGTPICFESTFPSSSRGFVLAGADLLATVTNDAWFAGGSEQHAHFAATVFRAIETRRWTIQSANGGVSGLVDPRGHIVTERRDEGLLIGSARRRTEISLYTRFGDAPWWSLSLVGMVGVLAVRWRAARRRRERDGGE